MTDNSFAGEKILIVDDEEFNLDILREYLEDENFEVESAVNGKEAFEKLQKSKDFAAIVLDRMMPVMDGMEFISKIKSDDYFSDIPVVMQTAASDAKQIKEGIEAGVFYYLTKPYDRGTFIAVLRSALSQSMKHKKVSDEFFAQKHTLSMTQEALFRFQSLDQAEDISISIAGICKEPDKVLFGLHELTTNAIEHGNLGISYDEKKVLLERNQWKVEINKRVGSKKFKDKFAMLHLVDKDDEWEVTISDCGNGFDFDKYSDIEATRMVDPNGRGIAITRLYSFDNMEYLGNGNEVRCVVPKADIESDS